MNTISIHVPDALAVVFENANSEKKKKAEQFISAWLGSFLEAKSPDERLFNIMQEATAIANRNGMTPEILEELLKDGE